MINFADLSHDSHFRVRSDDPPVGCFMANKGTPTAPNAKKPGRTLKEKRAAKAEKQVSQAAVRKAWEK